MAFMPLQSIFRRPLRLAIDATLVGLSLITAYSLRFEGQIPSAHLTQMLVFLPYVIAIRLVANRVVGVYRISWRFISLRDLPTVATALFGPSVILLILRLTLPQRLDLMRVPLSIIALEGLLSFMALLGIRTIFRSFVEHRRLPEGPTARTTRPVLLVGAGSNGFVIAREIQARPDLGLNLVGFLDDDAFKIGQTIHGVAVLGPTRALPELVKRHSIDRVIITIVNASRTQIQRIVELCESVPVKAQILPALHELVDGSVSVTRVRDVQVEDLLGRDPVHLDTQAIEKFIRNNHVLVTGAGGSIGSEMCRQVCQFGPAKLILVERTENSLFDIDRELRAKFPHLQIAACVADIADQTRLDQVFQTDRPQVVIHAAAYKHVPLMEINAAEAVKNNVFGTRILADTAHRFEVESFVMISTDKAVNPTSVMGGTKRVAEMYVQDLSMRSKTRFITVRFGNVLGSVGSVIPIFKEQIARGGPVTVTHPDMKRYFMTIPEASRLVLQAATMGQGGEIYVLDMGEPVRVLTLAEQLIRLSGLRPHEDIEIVFTGIRPGEKLFEEIALNEEEVSKTRHSKIYVGSFAPVPAGDLHGSIVELETLARTGDSSAVREAVLRMVQSDGVSVTMRGQTSLTHSV